jgi:hypothetical protein
MIRLQVPSYQEWSVPLEKAEKLLLKIHAALGLSLDASSLFSFERSIDTSDCVDFENLIVSPPVNESFI